jgi:hypothetical protein
MLAEGDAGPAAVMLMAVAVAIGVSTGSWRYALGAATGLSLAFAAALVVPGRVHTRVVDLLHPLRYDDGGGFSQAGLAHLALGWGGWQGTGLGGGLTDRPGSIPAQATDYVLGIWTEETGALGLALALGLLSWLLVSAWSAARETRAGFDAYAACALATLLTVHTLWICAAVLGWLPLTGITTPLMSAGGSGQVGAAVVLALLVCAQPGAPERAIRHASGDLRLPRARTRPLRGAAALTVVAIAALAIATAVTTSSAGETLNRRPDNPLRALATLRRGEIRTADGSVLAFSRHTGSLDRVARGYHHVSLTGALVGRMSATNAGSGLEEAWGAMLRCGGSGQARLADAAGRRGVHRVAGNPATCRPADLVLTLHERLQRAARAALAGRHGAALVLDARSGAVLAAYGRLDKRASSLQASPALELSLAPGSTFKLVVAAAALRGHIDVDTPLATGYQAVDGRWLPNAGGELCGGTLQAALAYSCNSAFAELAHRLGFDPLLGTAARLGFGRRTRLSGLAVATSSVGGDAPRDDDLLAASAIGQGRVTATPLQMGRIAAAIAADGVAAAPRLVAAACTDDHAIARTRSARHRVLPRAVARDLTAAMRTVVTEGTGERLAALPGRWAAKTGTAELPQLKQALSPAGTAAWMVAFPTDPMSAGAGLAGSIPVIATLVLPDTAERMRIGGEDAGDVTRRLAEALARAPQGGADPC